MAAKPKPAERTLALVHGKDAYAARFVETGFAKTPADDLDFALGYPWYATVVDGHKADTDAASRAAHKMKLGLLTLRGVPAGIVERYVRGWDKLLNNEARTKLLAAKDAPITAAEATALAQQHVVAFRGSTLLAWLEAIVGPAPVWLGVRQRLVKNASWLVADDAETGSAIYQLGFIVRRMEPKAAKAALAVLEDAYASHRNAKVDHQGQSAEIKKLDLVLHGTEGAERSADRWKGEASAFQLDHVLDDKPFVGGIVAARKFVSGQDCNPRRTFLGGAQALEAEIALAKRYKATTFAAEFGRINSPRLAAYFQEQA